MINDKLQQVDPESRGTSAASAVAVATESEEQVINQLRREVCYTNLEMRPFELPEACLMALNINALSQCVVCLAGTVGLGLRDRRGSPARVTLSANHLASGRSWFSLSFPPACNVCCSRCAVMREMVTLRLLHTA